MAGTKQLPGLIRHLGKRSIVIVRTLLDAVFGISIGAIVTLTIAVDCRLYTADAEAQKTQQESGASAQQQNEELAKELVQLRSQVGEKTIELDRQREQFIVAVNELKAEHEAERNEISELMAKKRKKDERGRETHVATGRQGKLSSSNQILNDLVRRNEANQFFRLNYSGTLVLNNKYLITGRPIKSNNYDVTFWASCLIEVRNAITGEVVSRAVFKKDVAQTLSVEKAGANLVLSVIPDSSSDCLFAASN